jgi:hypothetical protein
MGKNFDNPTAHNRRVDLSKETFVDIDVPMRELGAIDITELKDCILSQDRAAWDENLNRQQSYEVHRDTESIVMLFCDESWPDGEIYRETGWKRISNVALPLIEHIIELHYEPGGVLLRAVAANLKAGGRIRPHRDSLKSFHMGHRIHIPITTNPSVRFSIDGRPFAMQPGKIYELNNQLKHSVMNMGGEDRITFIFDYVPPALVPN